MKGLIAVCAAVCTVALAPLAAQAQLDEKDLKGRDVTFHGCVQQGATKDHFFLAQFTHMPGTGEAALPKVLADGRRVAFLFEDLPKLDKYFNQMVEVKGELLGAREGQTEPKLRDGQQIVEFEVPGRDVDLTAAQARESVGTSGTAAPMKLMLIRVDVDDVKSVAASCK